MSTPKEVELLSLSNLDWDAYENAGFGDPYADLPKHGGNFGKAVAVCINSLQCIRPIARGVMCPSFRVTGNANHSPGGRVRLLKQALNSDDPKAALLQSELMEAMALCVSCKGCKRECDSGIDMAAIKTEYQAQLRELKFTLRERLFSELPFLLSEYRKSMRLLFALRNRSSLLSWILDKQLKINPSKKLPSIAPVSFFGRQTKRSREYFRLQNRIVTDEPIAPTKKEVFLLVDTFNNHFSPEIAESAISVLEKLGYKVNLYTDLMFKGDRFLCCGRTQYSNGNINGAKREAERLITALEPVINSNMPIVGLEPSCLLMLRDEYLSLDLGEKAQKASKLALLFEEFLAKEIASGAIGDDVFEWTSNREVKIHGHCHQKSVGAMKSMRKVLSKVANLNVDFVESSCCGGAGSFAFESENSEAAKAMIELSIVPALEEAPHAVVISNGFSCNKQIENHMQRQTFHLAQFLDHVVVSGTAKVLEL